MLTDEQKALLMDVAILGALGLIFLSTMSGSGGLRERKPKVVHRDPHCKIYINEGKYPERFPPFPVGNVLHPNVSDVATVIAQAYEIQKINERFNLLRIFLY